MKYTGETRLEATIRNSLESLKIPFIQEAKVGRRSVDFVIPKLKVALEADGRYWHDDPAKDRRKTRYLQKHGWIVVRVSDKEVNRTKDLGKLIIRKLNKVSDTKVFGFNPS